MKLADLIDGTHGEVRRTPEFDRVFSLPRKAETDWSAVARALTVHLRGDGMALWPTQAEALISIVDHGGSFCAVGVGGGKTLISYLASILLGEPVLLLVPGGLREKTLRDFARYRKHWPETQTTILTYEKLSRSSDLLAAIGGEAPRVLVLDEAHEVKNLESGRTKKLVRFLRAHDCRVIAMSGTMTSRSILDFWHLLAATHGLKMPLPTKRSEAAMWGRAVDEKVELRARPGAFSLFGGVDLATARAVVRERVFSTPGTVFAESPDCNASIRIRIVHPDVPKEARSVLRRLQKDKIGPNEEECTPAEVWRHRRTLVLNFAYVWRHPAPKPWLAARSGWARFVREVLESGDPRFDTESQVRAGCQRGDLPRKAWDAWDAVRRSFKPESIPRWYGDPVLPRLENPTWVWVEHVAYGEELSRRLKLPYYHEEGFSRDRRFVENHPPDRSAILSIGSCHRGFNLQFLSRNVITTPPSTGKLAEQIIGRSHRTGQEADVVDVEVWCTLQDDDFAQAMADAEYVGGAQKLLLADFL